MRMKETKKKEAKMAQWIRNKVNKLKEPRVILLNVAELALVILAVLTFAGTKFIGRNLDQRIFFVCLCIYLVYPIYKIIDHVMTTVSDIKNGTWKWKK